MRISDQLRILHFPQASFLRPDLPLTPVFFFRAQADHEAAAAALNAGGARTSNPQLQARLDLLAEFARRGDLRSFVRVFVPHDLTQEDIDFFANELEQDQERWWGCHFSLTLLLLLCVKTHLVDDTQCGPFNHQPNTP